MSIEKIANYMKSASDTPMSEYTRQSNEITKNIKVINSSWEKLQKKYKEQLKNNPNGWQGIGKGSELGTLVMETKRTMESFENFV